MDTLVHPRRARQGFTLVEMLVVIIIIAILGSLLLGAIVLARRAANRAVLETNLKQFDMALNDYQGKFGFPPSFGHVNHSDATLRTKARSAVLAHLRKRFSRLQIPGATVDARWTNFCNLVGGNYQVLNPVSGASEPLDPNRFDDASSLVFWLGGLPEQAAPSGEWIPAGFNADPAHPFRSGGPRTTPHFELKSENGAVVAAEPHPDDLNDDTLVRFLRYYPKRIVAPIVYFKPRRVGANWEYGDLDSGGNPVQFSYRHATGNICVPYADPNDPPRWRNYKTCQVVTTGGDEEFGTGGEQVTRTTRTGAGFSLPDFDNQTNFCQGTLEDEIQ